MYNWNYSNLGSFSVNIKAMKNDEIVSRTFIFSHPPSNCLSVHGCRRVGTSPSWHCVRRRGPVYHRADRDKQNIHLKIYQILKYNFYFRQIREWSIIMTNELSPVKKRKTILFLFYYSNIKCLDHLWFLLKNSKRNKFSEITHMCQ